MFNTKKNKIKELEERLVWIQARNNMLTMQLKWLEDRFNAQIEETEKWRTLCHELYKAQEK